MIEMGPKQVLRTSVRFSHDFMLVCRHVPGPNHILWDMQLDRNITKLTDPHGLCAALAEDGVALLSTYQIEALVKLHVTELYKRGSTTRRIADLVAEAQVAGGGK